jgi:ubiquinol-cytochrome c reductase cytochrome c1 subunit
MKLLKRLIASLVLLPAFAIAAGDGGIPLDRAPARSTDISSLQHGAKLFVNYCLNCHSASAMRYSRLQDIGLTEAQIKDNLLFTGQRVGDLMNIAMTPKDAKDWFGATPPDLSVIARAKASSAGTGPDWLYTYLRSYYKDDTRPTGWNNLLFQDVAMPHALWELQGIRKAKFEDVADPHDPSKTIRKFVGYEMVKEGKLSPVEFDYAVADLVGYLEWMAEPAQNTRKRLGVWVLLFLGLFAVLAWRLNASYWRDIK